MGLSRWRFFLLGGVLTGVALVSALLNIQHTFARVQPAPPLQATDGTICPLSDTQEKESIQAFKAMMPTFQDPRCINCHGAVNPFAANGGHLGGQLDPKMETVTDVDELTGKETQRVRLANDQTKQCQNCHSGLPDWHIPLADLFFVGKDAPTLCEQMKFNSSTAALFIAHLEHDRSADQTQFIAEAFKGTRALDDNGQATYQNATGNDYKLEPPPITRAQFVELGRAWIKAMGGEFKGGNTCGCKPHRYALKIGAEIGYVFDGPVGSGSLKGKIDSHVDFKIPITFKDDGSFSDETTSDQTVAGVLLIFTPAGDGSCKLTATVSKEVWKVDGSQPPSGGWFDIKLSNTWPNPAELKDECVMAGGAAGASMAAPLSLGPAGLVSFQMPNELDGSPNGQPNPLVVSQLPSIYNLTVHWVDESAP